jgi:UDP-glucuronate 4-epimerase
MEHQVKPEVLVTGAAGFIGFHLCRRLLRGGCRVVGIDNMNDYYDVTLKRDRLKEIEGNPDFTFLRMDIADREAVEGLFGERRFDYVLHMAAQAGVRYSAVNPHVFIDSNVTGFLNILEGSRKSGVKHLIYASSSSVYGANRQLPFSVHHHTEHPISLYGATKKMDELMAHAYASLYSLPCTGLRLFTVYGPWGRPDMACYLFALSIRDGRPIKLFNEGKMKRDFTYIDDVAEAAFRVMTRPPVASKVWDGENPDPATSYVPFRLYNVGNRRPLELLTLVELLEALLGKEAVKELVPPVPGDVLATCADDDGLRDYIDYSPSVPLEEGVGRFVEWFRGYHGSL